MSALRGKDGIGVTIFVSKCHTPSHSRLCCIINCGGNGHPITFQDIERCDGQDGRNDGKAFWQSVIERRRMRNRAEGTNRKLASYEVAGNAPQNLIRPGGTVETFTRHSVPAFPSSLQDEFSFFTVTRHFVSG